MAPLDLTALSGSITAPDADAQVAARHRQDSLAKPLGALGRLEEIAAWLAGVTGQCPPPPLRHPALAIFAGDHGVARTVGTSAYPPEITAQMVAAFASGSAAATVLARSGGVSVRVVDAGVDVDWAAAGLPVPEDVTRHRIRRGTGSIDREDAMSRAEAEASLALGGQVADDLIAAGADLLIAGDMGIGNTTPAAALVGVIADLEPAEVVGRGTGIDDATWMRKTAAVRDAMRRGRRVGSEPLALLAACGGPDLGATTGFLLQAAARRRPVLLDGIISCTCALLAREIAPTAAQWWAASHRSAEPAAAAALERLGLEPLLDLGLRLGEGTGALLALPLVSAAGDLLREMAALAELGGPGDQSEAPGAPAPAGEGGAPTPDAPGPTHVTPSHEAGSAGAAQFA
jgi:nicotinate-nucleotide--dimethylbenzimidazole phosphoribosyltransferase